MPSFDPCFTLLADHPSSSIFLDRVHEYYIHIAGDDECSPQSATEVLSAYPVGVDTSRFPTPPRSQPASLDTSKLHDLGTWNVNGRIEHSSGLSLVALVGWLNRPFESLFKVRSPLV